MHVVERRRASRLQLAPEHASAQSGILLFLKGVLELAKCRLLSKRIEVEHRVSLITRDPEVLKKAAYRDDGRLVLVFADYVG